MIHAIRNIIEAEGKECRVLKIDIKSAFQNRSRSDMMLALKKEEGCDKLLRMFSWMYNEKNV